MKTAICAIIKNEQDYLDEWLDYHLNLGIDEIYLYEDYDSLSHSAITEKYGDRVHLNSIDVVFESVEKKISEETIKKSSFFQEQLFSWFPIAYKNEFDWVLFIDIDEFLILKQPLHKLLEEYDDKSAIYIKWIFYGASGHIKKPQGKVMDNYTVFVPTPFDYGVNFKSFVNLKNYTSWERPIHGVKGGVYPTTNGGVHKALIKHYFTKSWEEWKFKLLSRGDTFPGHRKIDDFFKINEDLLPLKDELIAELEK